MSGRFRCIDHIARNNYDKNSSKHWDTFHFCILGIILQFTHKHLLSKNWSYWRILSTLEHNFYFTKPYKSYFAYSNSNLIGILGKHPKSCKLRNSSLNKADIFALCSNDILLRKLYNWPHYCMIYMSSCIEDICIQLTSKILHNIRSISLMMNKIYSSNFMNICCKIVRLRENTLIGMIK